MTREDALRELCRQYDIDPTDHSTTAGEDMGQYLEGDDRKPIERFVAVASGGEYTYLYVVATREEAALQATGNMGGSYAEAPVAIHDLDSGTLWQPHVSWEEVPPIEYAPPVS